MTLHDPLWQQPLDYAAVEDRQIIASAIGDAGVVGSPSLAVTQRAAGANMTVDVAPGRAVIAGVTGSYLCWSDDVENLAIAAAPSAGNSRIDLVYAQVRDAQATGSGSDQDWILGVVTGTPSGSPSAPTLPTHSIEIARVTLTDATTSITDGIITNSRAHSASLADRVWPLVNAASLTDATNISSSVQDWGDVVVATPPNRQVKVFASIDCWARAVSSTPASPSVALAILRGATTVSTTTPVRATSETSLSGVALARRAYAAFTPNPGEQVKVRGRIQSAAGDNVDFLNGIITVQVFPA